MEEFNILSAHCSVSGSFLLEASAGTGKTFAIEHLFVRAILEGVPLESILMMTFTRKAARQLKVRVRKNLEKVYGKISLDDASVHLPEYIGDYLSSDSIGRAKNLLKTAHESIEHLSVFTIHGFCQFLLEQDIFGYIPTVVDQGIWEQQVGPIHLARYIHSTITKKDFPLTEEEWDYLVQYGWNFSSKNIYEALLRYDWSNPYLHREISWKDIIKDLFKILHENCSDVHACWEQYVSLGFPFKGFSGTKKNGHIQTAKNFFLSLKKEEHTLSYLRSLWKGMLLLNSNNQLKRSVHQKLNTEWINIALSRYGKSLEYICSGDLFLSRLLFYLSESSWWKSVCLNEGAQPDSLLHGVLYRFRNDLDFLQRSRDKFSYIIIDEFQDTDPCQWEIFKELFFSSENAKRVVLVGDPKQSIYSFRQSDVYTYFKASSNLPQRYTLQKNFRSKSSLVDGLNGLFSGAKQWLFLPKSGEHIDPHQVSAHHIDAKALQRVHFIDWNGNWHHLFQLTKQHIVHLIDQGICPSKIAILVSRHSMAQDMLSVMKGVPIYIPRIFRSESKKVAYWLWVILEAITLRNDKSLSKLLCTPFLGFDWESMYDTALRQQIAAVVDNLFSVWTEERHSIGLARFMETSWKGRSFAEWFASCATLRERLVWRQLMVMFLQRADGKRQSFFDLKEWLCHLMSGKLMLQDPITRDYTHRSVHILTIHASKGLEFDCVFALGLADRSKDGTALAHRLISLEHLEVSVKTLGSALTQEEVCSYLNECDAEKLRLFYVAATRAKEHIFMPLPSPSKRVRPKRGAASPVELFGAQFGNEQFQEYRCLYDKIEEGKFVSLQAFLQQNAMLEPDFAIDTHNKSVFQKPGPMLLSRKEKPFLAFPKIFRRSFSGLTKKRSFEMAISKPQSYSWQHWMTLPQGPKVGTFIHDVLARAISLNGWIDSSMASAYISQNAPFPMKKEEVGAFSVLLKEIFSLPLPLLELSLAEIPEGNIAIEMPFFLEETPYMGVSGMWKGIIDCIVQHKGKVFLFDWKSNWLGEKIENYSDDLLWECCVEHGYFDQIRLYSLALKKKLESYDLEFGGGVVFFLRPGKGVIVPCA